MRYMPLYFDGSSNRSEHLVQVDIMNLQKLMKKLLSGDMDSFGTYDDRLITGFFNSLSEYVTNVKYVPIAVKPFCLSWDERKPLCLGKYKYDDIQVTELNGFHSIKLFSKTITRQFNNFLDFSPYTKINIYVPFFPLIELDPEKVYGHSVDVYLSFDAWAGKLAYYVYLDDLILINQNETLIGVNISIGSTNADDIKRNNILQSISLAGSLAGLGVGVASGNPLITAGSVGMLTKNVTQAMTNNINHLKNYKGGSGDRTEVYVDRHIQLIIERPKNVFIPDKEITGRPLEQTITLQSLTGFTKVGEIHFNPMNNETITSQEITEIVELLRTGVHL